MIRLGKKFSYDQINESEKTVLEISSVWQNVPW